LPTPLFTGVNQIYCITIAGGSTVYGHSLKQYSDHRERSERQRETMDLGLEDKVAIVAGASKGIGKAIALESW